MKTLLLILSAVDLVCMIVSLATGRGLWWLALLVAILAFVTAILED